jgi:Ca2+-binding EF-hand superfamily protein
MRASILLLCLLAVPAFAQAPAQPVPLPQWFVDIDTTKKGEVSREDFVKFRMKLFDQLNTSKSGKISLEEFLKVAEPPYTAEVAGGPSLEDRRNAARNEFQNLDTNRDGFLQRAEIEAVINSEFNQYDTNRDNKVTEAEVRLIVQRLLQQQQAQRQAAEAQRRRGLVALNDFIDMQLKEADKLDKNNDGKISQQEYLVLAGPADSPQTQGGLPFDVRKQLVLLKFKELDKNNDGVIDRTEVTASAVKQFLDADRDKDRFLNEEELKKFEEAEAARIRDLIPKIAPPTPPPAAPRPVQPQQQRPPAPPPGLPQTR